MKKIKQWQGLKFGLFMHWGPYSQWGVAESWTICPDEWVERTGPYSDNYFVYKTKYEELPKTFNPVDFNPEKWAQAAKAAGMRYVVFTTKHHDGFCMFDTQQTDYKITASDVPFSSHPRHNITKEIFNAFREEIFLIGAYFSKPDWHSEYYWWPYFPPKGHDVNYNTTKYPQRWKQFQDFTYRQIEELMTSYGRVDILWLDGGWVRPAAKADDPLNQDINMSRIASMARSRQPGLIMVDRTVGGPFENYFTPEQQVPDKPFDYPWETCMTMGTSWSYKPDDAYKSAHELIDLMVKVVSRGGNFLLNVGPNAQGDWDQVVYQRLEEVGRWMSINGEAIYDTHPIAPYAVENICFTQSNELTHLYAFWMSEQEAISLPQEMNLPLSDVNGIKEVTLLGKADSLGWQFDNHILKIHIPASLQKGAGLKHCAVFKIIAQE